MLSHCCPGMPRHHYSVLNSMVLVVVALGVTTWSALSATPALVSPCGARIKKWMEAVTRFRPPLAAAQTADPRGLNSSDPVVEAANERIRREALRQLTLVDPEDDDTALPPLKGIDRHHHTRTTPEAAERHESLLGDVDDGTEDFDGLIEAASDWSRDHPPAPGEG